MSEVRRHKLVAEGVWWLLTAVVAIGVIIPILIKVPDYPFYWQNMFFVVAFITFIRYIFFLKYTFIARMKWIKLAIILGSVLFVFILMTALQDFRNFMDERGLQSLVTELNVYQQTRIIRYIKQEMIFFGVGSIITTILMAFRMILSLWRMKNSGRV